MYPDVDIPKPNGFLLPKWHSDPLFRGSYSNWPAGYLKALQAQLSAPVGDGRLVFSGEATSCEYYGFLHGAYFEGIRAAKEVLQCLGAGCAAASVTQDILKGCNGL
jgi:polyamine oxidase